MVYTHPMLARTFSCAVVGLDGVIVEVEVDYSNALPGMTVLEMEISLHKIYTSA